MSSIYKTGVIHGRFQGLHNGHMEYLLEAKKRCAHLTIGITNYTCKERNHKISSIDTHRLKESDNPFTYYQRMQMIEGVLLEAGINRNEFDIVPFPIERPEEIINFVPKNAVYFMTIYDEWGKYKLNQLKSLGFEVEVMWDNKTKYVSGTLVREKIRSNEQWKDLVPPYVYNYIENEIAGGEKI